MTKTVFNQNNINFSKEPMFFGADQNVQRYDVFKHPQFDKLNQIMLGYFWRPEEVSLQKRSRRNSCSQTKTGLGKFKKRYCQTRSETFNTICTNAF